MLEDEGERKWEKAETISNANLRLQPQSRWFKYVDKEGLGLDNSMCTLTSKAHQISLGLHLLLHR